MSHYFIDDKNLSDDIRRFNYSFGGKRFEFVSNSGLFSHGSVDAATDLLLRNLPVLEGDLLDLGCGWGVVGVVLGALYPISVTMSDINRRATEIARKNATDNNVKVNIIESDAFENIKSSFDTIILNPPIHAGKEVMYRMYRESVYHLNNGGKLFVVIQKKHGAESSLKELCNIFGKENIKTIYRKKGIFVIECKFVGEKTK